MPSTMDPGLIPVAALAIGFVLGLVLAALAVQTLVAWHRIGRLAAFLEALAAAGPDAPDAKAPPADPRLTRSLELLTARLVETTSLATTDLLTRVMNRQASLTRLAAEIERAARYGRRLSVALLDIDHFKRVNDTYGHAAGDLVLREVATLLRSNLRAVDAIGRYGGEEFVLVLPETDVDAAAGLVESLRRVVAGVEIDLDGGDSVRVTMSAGVTGGVGGQLRLDRLVQEADSALYAAKALGRDQVYVFRELDDERFVGRAPISSLARQDAVAVGRAAFDVAREHLTAALDDRTPWAGKPSLMIAEVGVAIARAVGLPEGEIERVRTASLLHDLGKLAIADEILAKPSDLDEQEWRAVAEHPKIGQVILEQAGALRDAAAIVVHHHEWFDGRGYPNGLARDEIPIGSRIVAIADAYEAMVSGRPYRDAVTHEAALEELDRYAGVQFDPQLVQVFRSLFVGGVPWPGSGDALAAHRLALAAEVDGSASHGHPHPHPHAHGRTDAGRLTPGQAAAAAIGEAGESTELATGTTG